MTVEILTHHQQQLDRPAGDLDGGGKEVQPPDLGAALPVGHRPDIAGMREEGAIDEARPHPHTS